MDCSFKSAGAALLATTLLLPAAGHTEGVKVTPAHEHELARVQGIAGPAETAGVASSELLGAVPLGEDFPALQGRMLRARIVTMEPGGVIAVHQHDARPGVAYVLEGEMTETRNDMPEPQMRTAGMASFEKAGVVHWWINSGTTRARVMVVDIVAEETR